MADAFERARDVVANDPMMWAPRMFDQRDIHGLGQITTADPVTEYWTWFLSERSQLHLEAPIVDDRHVTPYINHGRWIADCPECNGAMACWDQNPHGCCLSCGHRYKVDWQAPDVRADACRALGERGDDRRLWNWDAHKGETVDRLRSENILLAGHAAHDRADHFRKAGLPVPDEVLEWEAQHKRRAS